MGVIGITQLESSLGKVNAKLDISIDRVTEELAQIAFFETQRNRFVDSRDRNAGRG
jgi:hypothetical protein